jgi:hypothetical protein
MTDVVEYFHGFTRGRSFYRFAPGQPTLWIGRRGPELPVAVIPAGMEDGRIRARRERAVHVPGWVLEAVRDKERSRRKAEEFLRAYTTRYPDVATFRATNYFVQASCGRPVPLTPEQREAQRDLQRATRAVTWGYLMGGPTGRFRVNHPELEKAARRYFDLPVEGDIVAGKGSCSGDWFIGTHEGESKQWRDETAVRLRDGATVHVLTKTVKVVEKRA